ncbi:hypothetical protein EMCRGX_G003711 [Ephydatia muelleri]
MNQRPYENTAIKCIAQHCTSKSKSKEQGTPKTISETKTEQHSISASEPVHCAKATGLNIARSNQQRPCSVKSSDRSRSFAQQQLHQDSGTTITGTRVKIPPKIVAAPTPTRPKPPPTLTQPPSTPTTTTTYATPTEPSGAFTLTSHMARISPFQLEATVASVSAVVTPSKPPPPLMATVGAALGPTGCKVKKNSSQKEVKKPAPIKPKAGDKADIQAAVAKQGKLPKND